MITGTAMAQLVEDWQTYVSGSFQPNERQIDHLHDQLQRFVRDDAELTMRFKQFRGELAERSQRSAVKPDHFLAFLRARYTPPPRRLDEPPRERCAFCAGTGYMPIVWPRAYEHSPTGDVTPRRVPPASYVPGEPYQGNGSLYQENLPCICRDREGVSLNESERRLRRQHLRWFANAAAGAWAFERGRKLSAQAAVNCYAYRICQDTWQPRERKDGKDAGRAKDRHRGTQEDDSALSGADRGARRDNQSAAQGTGSTAPDGFDVPDEDIPF